MEQAICMHHDESLQWCRIDAKISHLEPTNLPSFLINLLFEHKYSRHFWITAQYVVCVKSVKAVGFATELHLTADTRLA